MRQRLLVLVGALTFLAVPGVSAAQSIAGTVSRAQSEKEEPVERVDEKDQTGEKGSEPARDVDVLLNHLSPGLLTNYLLEAIDALDLPAGVSTMLETPVVRLLDLLSDGNPANDMAACGQLTAFVSRVNVQERRGQLSPTEGHALRQSAATVAAFPGCQ